MCMCCSRVYNFGNMNFPVKLTQATKWKKNYRKICLKRISFKWKRFSLRSNVDKSHEQKCLVLVMAECFAVMPVMNLNAKNTTDLYYSWKSFRNFYSIFNMLLIFGFTLIVIMWSLSARLRFDTIIVDIFYLSNCFARMCFLSLAKKWPALMVQWQEVEQKIPTFESQQEKAMLAYRIKMISLVVMLLSLSEHLLKIISTAFYSILCTVDKTNLFEDYFRSEMRELFEYFEYSPFLAVFGKILNLLSTFLWTYMDLFIMVASVGLSTQFKKINRNLMKYKGQAMPEGYWIEIRSSYRNACKLCESVDAAIGPITLVSFANNLFFVCAQLLNSLNTKPTVAHSVYFWFSLIFLITRTTAVSLYTADVDDESKKPLRALRSCPMESWCTEVRRFYYEVSKDIVALSGMRFFYLTRSLLLSVAGTIVTYELVLIQFHRIDERPSDTC